MKLIDRVLLKPGGKSRTWFRHEGTRIIPTRGFVAELTVSQALGSSSASRSPETQSRDV